MSSETRSSDSFRRDRYRFHPLFDGYAAGENRGTLALAYTLNPAHSPGLLSSFSKRVLRGSFPVRRGDHIEARLQLVLAGGSRGSRAIPDAAFVNHTQKCLLLIESKVERGMLDVAQLRRHLLNAKRHFPGYRRVLLLVSPDPSGASATRTSRLRSQPDVLIRPIRWFDVHEWGWKYLGAAARDRRTSVTSIFLTRQLIEFLRGRDWMGFQGFPADWPEEYRISEAREHLKALRDRFSEHVRRQIRSWPPTLMPTEKKLTQPWFPVGDGKVHLTVYAWQDWTGVDLYVPHPVARRRLRAESEWNAFLGKIRSLPDQAQVWVKASRWRLINPKQGRQTGPMMDVIELSVRATDLLRRSKGDVLAGALRRLACDAATKALTVEYRYYFEDEQLQKKLREREFADRLIGSAKELLKLYRWFV